jgi:DNA-binding transcriptional LysR family regulator
LLKNVFQWRLRKQNQGLANVSIDTWDEIRTAFQVARLGTVSGAADVLGVHHATVIRHIDALEKRLGVRLFQRHARGYAATEAGRDLLGVAQATDEQFSQLASRIKGQGETVTGELVVTSITGIAGLLTPVMAEFQAMHPGLIVRFLTDMRLFRLDYGEAHVAIRAGGPPQEPDNVAQPLVRIRTGLYAARIYVEKYGLPQSIDEFSQHRFVANDNPENRAPFYRWLRETVPAECLSYLATEPASTEAALRAGAGIGFLSARLATGDPDLIEVLPPRPEWDSPLWIVTHVDLHRTLKVQSFLTHLKKAAQGWVGI